MPTYEEWLRKRLTPLLNDIKKTNFVEGYTATDEEAMGLLMAKYFIWDGLSILESCYSGLEDSNFHTENKTIQKLIDGFKGE
jgi:hypothetical protein